MRPPLRGEKPVVVPEVKVVPVIAPQYPLQLENKCVEISIDPGSIKCGISIFDLQGKFLDGFTVKAAPSIIPTMRLYHLRIEFTKEWERRLGPDVLANRCTLELLPPGCAAILDNAAGAILSSGKISADLHAGYIPPTRWKWVARQLGCFDKSPKGVSSLRAMGWEWPIANEDEDLADSIMVYLAARFIKGQVLWLGPNKWVKSWYVPTVYKPKTPKKRGRKKVEK